MEEDIRKKFGEKIQMLMLKKGKKQSDLSKELNIPDSTISDWCLGKVYPRLDRIMLLAKYFNIECSCLINNFEEDYIPKSKVKQKIEKLKILEENPKEAKHYVDWYSRRITALQELLEDDEYV